MRLATIVLCGFVVGTAATSPAKRQTPVERDPRPWAGDWMLSSRVVASTGVFGIGFVQVQPVLEGFVYKNLSLGGFLSGGYMHVQVDGPGKDLPDGGIGTLSLVHDRDRNPSGAQIPEVLSGSSSPFSALISAVFETSGGDSITFCFVSSMSETAVADRGSGSGISARYLSVTA